MYIPLLPVGGPHIQCDRRNSVDSLARRPTFVKYSQIRITHFVSSFLWAPPVATQFSVLSKNIHKVRAPPVATLLFHLISSPHFFGHRLWRLSFLLFGHRQWRPLSFHITDSFLWGPPVATQFSSLSYNELYVRAPSVATLLCHLSSSPHVSGLRLWRLSFLFCHCVCGSLGFVNLCLLIIVLKFFCYLPLLYRPECSTHPLSACTGCHQCF